MTDEQELIDTALAQFDRQLAGVFHGHTQAYLYSTLPYPLTLPNWVGEADPVTGLELRD